MGVKRLSHIINLLAKDAMVPVSMDELDGTKMVVDASYMIFRTNVHGKLDRNYIDLIFNYNYIALISGVEPVWVFDGKSPELKNITLDERRLMKAKAEQRLIEAETEEERIRAKKKTFRVTNTHISEVQSLLTLLGIPFVEAIEEADPQCAAICKSGLANFVATDDWDVLPFGSPIMIKNFPNRKNIKKINLDILLKKLKMSLPEFIDLCIIMGTDYCPGINGVKPFMAYKIYMSLKKKYGGNVMVNFINYAKKQNYYVPADFYEQWKKAKEYFLKLSVINPNNLDLKWNKPNFSDLKLFLKEKSDFDEETIDKKIDALKSIHRKYSRSGYLTRRYFRDHLDSKKN